MPWPLTTRKGAEAEVGPSIVATMRTDFGSFGWSLIFWCLSTKNWMAGSPKKYCADPSEVVQSSSEKSSKVSMLVATALFIAF
jgi:hypothetical protein